MHFEKSAARTQYLREAAQHQPHQLPDVGEGRVAGGVADVLAADVQHRAQRHSTERDVVTHVEQEAVEVLPQLHGLAGRDGVSQVVVRLMASL